MGVFCLLVELHQEESAPAACLAGFFTFINVLYTLINHYYLCLRLIKSEDNAKPILKKVLKKILFLSRSGVTTCWKRCDNSVITGTFGFCHTPEVVSDRVYMQEILISEMYVLSRNPEEIVGPFKKKNPSHSLEKIS